MEFKQNECSGDDVHARGVDPLADGRHQIHAGATKHARDTDCGPTNLGGRRIATVTSVGN